MNASTAPQALQPTAPEMTPEEQEQVAMFKKFQEETKKKQGKLQEQAEKKEMARLEKVAESLRSLPRSSLRSPPGLTHPSRLAVDPNSKSSFLILTGLVC